jgi:hypothetical protein
MIQVGQNTNTHFLVTPLLNGGGMEVLNAFSTLIELTSRPYERCKYSIPRRPSAVSTM